MVNDNIQKSRELSKSIVDYIRGTTGNNFQNNLNIILKKYYKINGKTFEMPQAMRGDGKNDGWVIEDNTYYMMFAPVVIKDSFYKSIVKKFKDDLEGLLDNVYKNDMWGKKVNKAICIVNTRDGRLPPDTNREYDKIYNENRRKYNIDFQYSISNLDLIQEMLEELSVDDLLEINFKLNMARTTDYNEPNASEIMETIGLIAKESATQLTFGKSSDYVRISTPKKIKENNLEQVEVEINAIIKNLGIVDTVINEMSQDTEHYKQFENTKNYIIGIYDKYKMEYNGEELYNFIVDYFSDLFSNANESIYAIKYLVVHIFDKCDIFEKEGV